MGRQMTCYKTQRGYIEISLYTRKPITGQN